MAALKTYSKFYYGLEIIETNCYIEFQDVGDQMAVTLDVGQYTLAGLLVELLRVLNFNGAQVYTGTLDRATRQITISAPGPFKLFTNTGATKDTSAFPVLGFNTDTDYEGEDSYTGELGMGKEWAPQFFLQSYVPSKQNRKAIDASVKKSTNGKIEAIRFGVEWRMSCEALFITDIPHPSTSPIRTNTNAYDDVLDFMDYATKKAVIEFMADESDPSTYEVFKLDSTESDPTGMGFELVEEYDQSMPGYYRTGKLTWLKQENA